MLMLGTNDLKQRFSLSHGEIGLAVSRLVDTIGRSSCGRYGSSPKVLLLSPPFIGELSEYGEFFEGARPKSQRLGEAYGTVAIEYDCAFLDTSQYVKASAVDGMHLDQGAHATFARLPDF